MMMQLSCPDKDIQFSYMQNHSTIRKSMHSSTVNGFSPSIFSFFLLSIDMIDHLIIMATLAMIKSGCNCCDYGNFVAFMDR